MPDPDAPWYGLLVCWGDDARMFVVNPHRTIGQLAEFCRDRYGLAGGPLEMREWGGRAYKLSELVPPEGTALVLSRT